MLHYYTYIIIITSDLHLNTLALIQKTLSDLGFSNNQLVLVMLFISVIEYRISNIERSAEYILILSRFSIVC